MDDQTLRKYQDIAKAYLEYHRWKESKPSRQERMAHGDEKFLAWEAVHELVRRDPAAGWELTKILMDIADENEIFHVAAGPLYDLVHYHLELIHSELEILARRNAKIRAAVRQFRLYEWLK